MTSLSDHYFRPKSIELDGRLYEWFGVVPFKRALMSVITVDPKRMTTSAYVLAGRTLADARTFERKSRRSEVIHLLGLMFAVTLLGLAAAHRSWSHSVPGIVIFVANFHCYILQRYNRIRVYRLLGRVRPGPFRPDSDPCRHERS